MKIVNYLLALIMVSALSACVNTTVSENTDVLVSAVNVKYYYENGDLVNIVERDTFSDEELETLIEAMDAVRLAKSKLKLIEQAPTKLITHLPEVTLEYTKVKSAYMKVRGIAISHKDEYTATEWEALVEFDDSVKVLDDQFTQLVANARPTGAIGVALRLADTAYKLGESF